MLSSSLLQSINSNVGDGPEDPFTASKRKKKVIENWAEDVKEAAERGELELQEEETDEDDDDDEGTVDEDEKGEKNRKTKQKKRKHDEMSASFVSSLISDDPLSNQPVLDDGVGT